MPLVDVRPQWFVQGRRKRYVQSTAVKAAKRLREMTMVERTRFIVGMAHTNHEGLHQILSAEQALIKAAKAEVDKQNRLMNRPRQQPLSASLMRQAAKKLARAQKESNRWVDIQVDMVRKQWAIVAAGHALRVQPGQVFAMDFAGVAHDTAEI